MKRTRTTSTHPRRRSAAAHLDPYAVDGTTLTLQEWQKLNGVTPRRKAHRRHQQPSDPTAAAA